MNPLRQGGGGGGGGAEGGGDDGGGGIFRPRRPRRPRRRRSRNRGATLLVCSLPLAAAAVILSLYSNAVASAAAVEDDGGGRGVDRARGHGRGRDDDDDDDKDRGPSERRSGPPRPNNSTTTNDVDVSAPGVSSDGGFPPLPPSVLSTALSARIIGGRQSSAGRFPYMASLTIHGTHFCGGTVVAPDVILTAGHCGAINGLVVGNHARRTGGQEFAIAEKVTHEDYSYTGFRFDAMLVKIDGRTDVHPVAVNKNPVAPSPRSTVTVMGWGVTDMANRKMSDVLMEVNVEAMYQNDCSNSYESGKVKNEMMCAKGFGRWDSCQGDSGGPSVVAGRSASQDVQVGVVSWGYGCADAKYPGVYTRVSEIYPWIRENTCALSDDPPEYFKCPAKKSRFTYVASLKRDGRHHCTGSLISADMVLTSGQCAAADEVQIGSASFTITDQWRPPRYSSAKKTSDILLLKLSGVSHNDPVEVNANQYQPGNSWDMSSFGQGVQDDYSGDYIDGLQKLDGSYTAKSKCGSSYGSVVTDDMMCTNDPRADVCHDDVGGPVVVDNGSADRDTLYGVVSWRRNCADPNYPQVSSRTSYNFPWIRAVVCEHSQYPNKPFYCGVETRYPYVASLRGTNGKERCSGVLVAPNAVLTSSECRGIETVVLDGEYTVNNEFSHLSDTDVGIKILKLNKKSQRSFLLPEQSKSYPMNGFPVVSPVIGKRGAASGVEYDGRQEIVKKALSNDYCATIYSKDAITENHLCAREAGYDFCTDDRGAPLVLKGSWPSADKLVGVYQWEKGCASEDSPTMFTRISSVYPWILQAVCGMVTSAPAGYDCTVVGGTGMQVETDSTTGGEGETGTPNNGRSNSNEVTVAIEFDKYPADIEWSVRADGAEKYKSEKYDNSLEFAHIQKKVSIKPNANSYEFTIRDISDWGAGMVDGNVGRYSLYWGDFEDRPLDESAKIFEFMGDFGEEETHKFNQDGLVATEERTVMMIMKTDASPNTISWELKHEDHNKKLVVVANGSYSKAFTKSVKKIKLRDGLTGKFVMAVHDSNGDGLQKGSWYRVKLKQGQDRPRQIGNSKGFKASAEHIFWV